MHFLADQEEATGVVPDDRTVVIERAATSWAIGVYAC